MRDQVAEAGIPCLKCEHPEAVVIHARPNIAGPPVLNLHQAPQSHANVATVDSKVGVVTRCQQGKQSESGHTRPLFACGRPGSFAVAAL